MAGHPNVIHVDDVEPIELDQGELRWTRRRLGAAAGARRLGVSRFEIEPGARSTPPHVHSTEEEIFWVLGGSGLLWQSGTSCAIAAGDCVVHRRNTEAHTLLAGDDGLDVLAFAEGSDDRMTYMPRTKMFWLGQRWLPADAPHPFAADDALGPLERPEPGPRPANVVTASEVAREDDNTPGYLGSEAKVSRAAGSRDLGLRHVELQPGQRSCPPHFHLGEEECFHMLSGDGRVWLGDEAFDLRPGSFVVRPPGEKVPHALEAGPGGMEYLAVGHDLAQEVVFYPDTNTVNISGILFRIEPAPYPS